MKLKPAYRHSPLSALFNFYPIEGLKSDTINAISNFLIKYNLQTEFFNLNNTVCEVVKSDSILGVEVEIERVPDALQSLLIPFWTQVNDNSLRNNGREFISCPAYPEMIRTLLILLFAGFDIMRKNKITIPEFSWRTSIHFHLNMRNETVEQLINFTVLYLLFEDALFDFVGEDRRTSNFCVPLQDTNLPNLLSIIINGKKPIDKLTRNWFKYTALNLRPLTYNDHASDHPEHSDTFNGKGTVEFRHLEGTYNINKIIAWMNLILLLQLASRKLSLDDIEDRIAGLDNKQNYTFFLREVFGDSLPAPKNFQKVLFSSVASAKECFCPMPNISEIYKAIDPAQTGLAEMIKLRERNTKPQIQKSTTRLSPKKISEINWGQNIPITGFAQFSDPEAPVAPVVSPVFLNWDPVTETVFTTTTTNSNGN